MAAELRRLLATERLLAAESAPAAERASVPFAGCCLKVTDLRFGAQGCYPVRYLISNAAKTRNDQETFWVTRPKIPRASLSLAKVPT